MRTIKLLFALLFISLFSCGPFEEVNMGYPESVAFSKEGGVEYISVDDAKAFRHITVIDYETAGEGMYISNDGEGGYCDYEWLRAESDCSKSLKIIAQPNTTNNSRTLWVELYSGYKYHVIKVEQL
jgi:hypothetical protein